MTTSVTMLQTRLGEDGTMWTVGTTHAATDAFAAILISSNYATGVLPKIGGIRGVGETITGSANLPSSAFGAITPYDSASSGTLTLPSAASAWASQPYGLVVVTQKGVGVPSFAAGGSDTLHATAGVSPCVQYGMCAAQVISSTEWALA